MSILLFTRLIYLNSASGHRKGANHNNLFQRHHLTLKQTLRHKWYNADPRKPTPFSGRALHVISKFTITQLEGDSNSSWHFQRKHKCRHIFSTTTDPINKFASFISRCISLSCSLFYDPAFRRRISSHNPPWWCQGQWIFYRIWLKSIQGKASEVTFLMTKMNKPRWGWDQCTEGCNKRPSEQWVVEVWTQIQIYRV